VAKDLSIYFCPIVQSKVVYSLSLSLSLQIGGLNNKRNEKLKTITGFSKNRKVFSIALF